MRARRLDLLALPASLLRREPVISARDAVPAMYALLDQVTAANTFSAVHADQTSMVQYALAAADQLARRTGQRPRLVLDAHNALYKVVERLAAPRAPQATLSLLTGAALCALLAPMCDTTTLDPDMAAVFPTSEAVNEALRVLAAAAKNLPSDSPQRQRRPHKSLAQTTQP